MCRILGHIRHIKHPPSHSLGSMCRMWPKIRHMKHPPSYSIGAMCWILLRILGQIRHMKHPPTISNGRMCRIWSDPTLKDQQRSSVFNWNEREFQHLSRAYCFRQVLIRPPSLAVVAAAALWVALFGGRPYGLLCLAGGPMGCCFASYILHLLSRRCFFHPQTQHFGCKSWRFWSQAWWISESRRVVTRRQAPRRLRRKEWMAQPSWNLSHTLELCANGAMVVIELLLLLNFEARRVFW